MLLISKKNLFVVSTLFFLGCPTILYADECGVIHYLANKSNGVTVTGNTCKTADNIALGSEFTLMPGARLWFKSQLDTEKAQGICQSRSSKPIRISVDNSKLPWIKPTGLSNCGAWTDNKMNCDDSSGGQKALSCVIAGINPESHSKGLEERTTSVTMRSVSPQNDANEGSVELDNEQIVSAMQPDISMCNTINHTNTPTKITWMVETDSRVNTVILDPDPANDADKPFIDCITAVIKDFSYPKSSQASWLSSQF